MVGRTDVLGGAGGEGGCLLRLGLSRLDGIDTILRLFAVLGGLLPCLGQSVDDPSPALWDPAAIEVGPLDRVEQAGQGAGLETDNFTKLTRVRISPKRR